MAENGRKFGADERLAALLAAGWTAGDAAKRCRIGERTVYRRLAEPDFRRRVAAIRRETTDRIVGRLTHAATAAVDALAALVVESETENIRLSAAKAVLDIALKHAGDADLTDRIAELERRVDDARTVAPAA